MPACAGTDVSIYARGAEALVCCRREDRCSLLSLCGTDLVPRRKLAAGIRSPLWARILLVMTLTVDFGIRRSRGAAQHKDPSHPVRSGTDDLARRAALVAGRKSLRDGSPWWMTTRGGAADRGGSRRAWPQNGIAGQPIKLDRFVVSWRKMPGD